MGNENCSQLWYIFPFSFSAIVAVCANLCFGVHSRLKLKIGNAEKNRAKNFGWECVQSAFLQCLTGTIQNTSKITKKHASGKVVI